jgi:hypothetical protein
LRAARDAGAAVRDFTDYSDGHYDHRADERGRMM